MINDTTVNGEGLRRCFFSQGCKHHCKGCFSKQTWPFTGGKIFDTDDLCRKVVEDQYLDGVTFSGGDPFDQPEPFAELAKQLKKHNINIWIYSGYTYEEILKISKKNKFFDTLIKNCDVLVDGKFVQSLYEPNLLFRGSSNQRIVDVQASLKNNVLILWQQKQL